MDSITAQAKTATLRELRKLLFDTDLYTVIGGKDEMTNKESRDYLYDLDDQDYVYNYAIEDGCLYIWG